MSELQTIKMICAKCRRVIDKVDMEFSVANNTQKIKVECHGEKAIKTFPLHTRAYIIENFYNGIMFFENDVEE
jgi:hypothetical protein